MSRLAKFSIIPLLSVILGCSPREQSSIDPLPALDTVNAITAQMRVLGEEASFAIPKSGWKSIYDALQPARIDSNPSKWVVLADIELESKGGQKFFVYAYESDGPGAFSAGKTFESRTYYRGGDSAKLKRLLLDARTK